MPSDSKAISDERMSTDTRGITFQASVPSTSSSGQARSSNKTRLPISILPDYPEEKQKHITGLKRFPYLSSKYSKNYSNNFVFNSSMPCPVLVPYVTKTIK